MENRLRTTYQKRIQVLIDLARKLDDQFDECANCTIIETSRCIELDCAWFDLRMICEYYSKIDD